MPGVSVLWSEESKTPQFEATLDGLCYFDRYTNRSLYDDDIVNLGFSGYESYPVHTFENKSYFVVLEGSLYATDRERDEVEMVANKIAAGRTNDIAEWLANRDGEFILVVIEKEINTVYVLNDALGRLPYYSYQDDDNVYLSRELGFILDIEDIDVDSMGVAQTLLFGYPLANRTLYQGVSQIQPGSLVTVSEGSCSSTQLYQPRLDEKSYSSRSVGENAKNLATLFSEACKRRSDLSGTNVVSLSGGLDSRAIAASFHANDLSFVATTYNKSDGGQSDEVAVAAEVMNVLEGDWQQFDLPPNSGNRMNELLQMKRGMNFLTMGYIHEFFDEIAELYGYDALYFAGDGGDKIFPPLSTRSFSTIEDVADHLIRAQHRFDIETVVELTKHTRSELKTEILNTIHSYPGDDPTKKYTQFLFWERGGKWVLHGEDRNRYFFWTPAPFYSLPLVEYAMKVPDKQKKRNKLYRETLHCLSPEAVKIEYSNAGASIDSFEYKMKQFALDILSRYPSIREKFVNLLKGELNSGYDEAIANVFLAQAGQSALFDEYLSEHKLREIANNPNGYDQKTIFYLLTVTTALEQLRTGETYLERSWVRDCW